MRKDNIKKKRIIEIERGRGMIDMEMSDKDRLEVDEMGLNGLNDERKVEEGVDKKKIIGLKIKENGEILMKRSEGKDNGMKLKNVI